MAKKVIVNGLNIGYLPPTDASEINYTRGGVTTTVEDAIDGKVSKSGDTMNGNLIVDRQDGTVSNLGQSTIVAGNTIPQGTVNNSQGRIFLCAANDKYSTIQTLQNLSANNTIFVPDKSGTIALTSDVPIQIVYIPNIQQHYSIRLTLADSDTFCLITLAGATGSNAMYMITSTASTTIFQNNYSVTKNSDRVFTITSTDYWTRGFIQAFAPVPNAVTYEVLN